MKLKHVKLYRPVTINGLARESVYEDSVKELRFAIHMNMVVLKDRREVPILVPLTNVEHMIPNESDFNRLDKAFTDAMSMDGIYDAPEQIMTIPETKKRKAKEVN